MDSAKIKELPCFQDMLNNRLSIKRNLNRWDKYFYKKKKYKNIKANFLLILVIIDKND